MAEILSEEVSEKSLTNAEKFIAESLPTISDKSAKINGNSQNLPVDLPKEALLSNEPKQDDAKSKGGLKCLFKKPSLSSLVSTMRKGKNKPEMDAFSKNPFLTDSDLRKYIFVAKRESEIMKGLKVKSFGKLTLLGNFMLGVFAGSLLTIFLKFFYELSIKVIIR